MTRGPQVVFFTRDVHHIRCTVEVKSFGEELDLSFVDAELATLCNSKRQMTTRWGPAGFATVSRRLCELAAVDGVDVTRLPGAAIESGEDGMVMISFDGNNLTVGAIPLERTKPIDDIRKADGLQIVSLALGDLS